MTEKVSTNLACPAASNTRLVGLSTWDSPEVYRPCKEKKASGAVHKAERRSWPILGDLTDRLLTGRLSRWTFAWKRTRRHVRQTTPGRTPIVDQ